MSFDDDVWFCGQGSCTGYDFLSSSLLGEDAAEEDENIDYYFCTTASFDVAELDGVESYGKDTDLNDDEEEEDEQVPYFPTNTFSKIIYKPSRLLRRPAKRGGNGNQAIARGRGNLWMREEHFRKNETWKISRVCSGGFHTQYNLFFIENDERTYFYMSSDTLQVLRKFEFSTLFDNMLKKMITKYHREKNFNSKNNNNCDHLTCSSLHRNEHVTLSETMCASREMKDIICNNANYVLFEMMDGRLYLFDIWKIILFPFPVVKFKSDSIIIYSNIMSEEIICYLKNQERTLRIWISKECNKDIQLPTECCNLKQVAAYSENFHYFVDMQNQLFMHQHSIFSGSSRAIIDDVTTRVLLPNQHTMVHSNIKQICCGASHILVLMDNGVVYTRGSNQYGQCGVHGASKLPEFMQIDVSTPVKSLSACPNCSVFITQNMFIFLGAVFDPFEQDDRSNVHDEDLKQQYYELHSRFKSVHIIKKEKRFETVECGTLCCFVYSGRHFMRSCDALRDGMLQFFSRLNYQLMEANQVSEDNRYTFIDLDVLCL
ncbi:hypothetical protein FDP41_010260 [Naegleria fowleri]|uniref:Uncharacterized protein n=1 Tax=Naegleria fowleri TaxID=5763 RepID=A0A6A5CCX4_NAEFO|nr:uncharacterized protein FDP41_010260 [Naegleria fowleri]KAF0983195.1 hypothetical protein FDP41_010260 [Naegleria fowleri]